MSQIYAFHFHMKHSFRNRELLSFIFVDSVQCMSTIKGSLLPEFRAEMIIKDMNRFVSFILRFDRCFFAEKMFLLWYFLCRLKWFCVTSYMNTLNIQDEIIFVLEIYIVYMHYCDLLTYINQMIYFPFMPPHCIHIFEFLFEKMSSKLFIRLFRNPMNTIYTSFSYRF